MLLAAIQHWTMFFQFQEHPNDCVGARVGDEIYSAESLPILVPPLTAFVFEAFG